MSEKITKIDRRRRKNREAIHQAMVELILHQGFETITMEKIAEQADIARSTLYTFYTSKEVIVESLLEELMQYAANKSEELKKESNVQRAFDGVLALYFNLYDTYPHEMKVSYQVQKVQLKKLDAPHHQFMANILALFERLEQANLLRIHNPIKSVRLLATIALPTLQMIGNEPQAEKIFKEALTGYLLKTPKIESEQLNKD